MSWIRNTVMHRRRDNNGTTKHGEKEEKKLQNIGLLKQEGTARTQK
jgi:hypothetical protein